MFRYVFVLLSCIILRAQGQGYGPIGKNPVTASPQVSENNALNFGSTDYGYIKPVAEAQNVKPIDNQYWWLNKKSPFVAVPDENVAVPVKNEITEVNYESNPFLELAAKDGACGGYNCVAKVPCVEEGYVCAPRYLCQNGVVDKSQLSQITNQDKFCFASNEVCCKISTQCGGSDCYASSQTVSVSPSYTQPPPIAAVPSYPQPAPAVAVIPSYSQTSYPQPPPPVSVVPSGYNRPEYGSSIVPSPSSSPAPYTGPQNTTPYPGCAAALKCVPDNYCTHDGVMSNTPVLLTKELLETRVPLSECIDLSSGIIGKCCRDPNYKDPWPDHDTHDHGDGHDHGHDHSHEHSHTEAPQVHYTIKKPIGGYQTKPDAFPATIPQPTTEAPRPVPSYSSSGSSGTYQYQVPNTYVPPPPASSQVYVPSQPSVPTQSYLPPAQTSYPTPPKPVPTYVPPPQPSYIPPVTQSPRPVASYVPPTQSTYKPQPVPAYVPPQPAAPYVPPQPPQPVGASYYPAPSITLTRQPQQPPLVIASDRVFEKSTIPPIVVQRDYSQCGVPAKDGTEYGEAPWHAVVHSTRNKDLNCGGVIVSENAVLTSAHCFEKSDSESLYVQVGPTANIYKVATVARHPQFEPNTLSRDLALAILKEPIKFDAYTQKICLPPPQSQVQSFNKECFISTQSDIFSPGKVQKLKVQTFSYKDCEIKLRNTYLGKYFTLQDTFTCASTPSTESELCQVIAGEPLVCNRGDGIFELYGIKSWDLGCQEYKKSAIFSNNDVLWIENSLVAPLEKLLTIENLLNKEKFKGESLEGVNIQGKPGFALGYGK